MKRFIKKTLRSIMVILTIILSMNIAVLEVRASENTEMNIYAMYLGDNNKGDSVLLESKGEYLLMDLGVSSHADDIIRQLKTLGVKELDIYLSHLHLDHVGGESGNFLAGLQEIIGAGYKIETLYLPEESLAPLSVDYADKYDRIEGYMADKCEIVYLNVGDTLTVGDAKGEIIGPLNVDKLHPDDYAGKEATGDGDEVDPKYTYYENNCSLAAIFTCGSTKFFTAGDALEEEVTFLIEKYAGTSKLDCDIMKYSHHGTGSGNTPEIMAAVSPSYSFGSNTGLTGTLSSTGMWEFRSAIKNASEYGVCYMVGSEKETVIYQVKNDVIKMYQGSSIQSGKYLTGWQEFVGSDGKNRFVDVYYFDKNGQPLTGVQYLNDQYFNFGIGGCMQYGNYDENGVYQGWKTTDSGKYYYTFSKDGKYSYMAHGLTKIDGASYLFGDDGKMFRSSKESEKEIVTFNGKKYAVGISGAVTIKDMATIGNNKYYFGKYGTMVKKKIITVDGKDYYFGKYGTLVRGKDGNVLVKVGKKTYCAGKSGALIKKNWATVGDDRYYFGKYGTMVTDYILSKDGNYYYFGTDGKMVKGNGGKGNELIKVDGKTYCVGKSGTLIKKNRATVGDDSYYFGKKATMLTNYKAKIEGNYYYFGSDGKMVRSKRVKIDGNYYYFGSNGKMCVNKTVTVNGVKYKCNKNGVMKKI